MATKLTMEEISNRAARETERGQAELLAKLRKLTTKELAKADPRLVARLTADQRVALFCKLDAQHAERQNKSIRIDSTSRSKFKNPLCKRIPVSLRSQLLGITGSSAIALLGIFHESIIFNADLMLSRPQAISRNALSWPTCARLSQRTDDCLYSIQVGMSWSRASELLGIDHDQLKRVNPHLSLSQSYLTKDDLLIVWRGITPIAEPSNVK